MRKPLGRVVAFGDKDVDSGNAFRIAGAPFPPVYPTGHVRAGARDLGETRDLIVRATRATSSPC